MCLSHPCLPFTVAGSGLVPFTINFTVTNLKYVENMHHPGSRKFNTTERILQKLVRHPLQCIQAHLQKKVTLTNPIHDC